MESSYFLAFVHRYDVANFFSHRYLESGDPVIFQNHFPRVCTASTNLNILILQMFLCTSLLLFWFLYAFPKAFYRILKNSFAFSNYIFVFYSVPFSRKNFWGGFGGQWICWGWFGWKQIAESGKIVPLWTNSVRLKQKRVYKLWIPKVGAADNT